jgi:hypothetical protein
VPLKDLKFRCTKCGSRLPDHVTKAGCGSVGPLPEFGAPALQVINHPQIHALNVGNVFQLLRGRARISASARLGPTIGRSSISCWLAVFRLIRRSS